MRWPWPSSLRNKLLLPLGLILAVAFCGGSWTIYVLTTRGIQADLVKRAQTLAESLQLSLSVSQDRWQWARMVNKMSMAPDVKTILVSLGDPAEVVGATNNAWIGKAVKALPDAHIRSELLKARYEHHLTQEFYEDLEMVEVLVPVELYQNAQALRPEQGEILIYLDASQVLDEARQTLLLLLAAFACALVLLLFLLYLAVSRLILHPVLSMGVVMTRLEAGESHVRSEPHGKDELAELGHSLNRMIEALQQSEDQTKRLSLVASEAHSAVIITDKDRRIEWVNDAFTRITGYAEKEVLGRSPGSILQGPDTDPRAVEHMRSCLRAGEGFEIEIVNHHRNGLPYWVAIECRPMRDERGELSGFMAIESDVTERRRAEKKLESESRRARHAAEQAEQANRAKSEFLANMSHEIRTPMNAILGFTQILSEKVREPELRDYLQTIDVSGNNLLRLINDILDLSRVESGKLQLQLGPVRLRDMLAELKRFFKPQLEHRKLGFKVEIDEELPEVLVLDELRLRQVLVNLIGNAIKFTDSGLVTVRVCEVIHSPESDEQDISFMISVRDTGIGIPRDQQERIFESFSQQHGHDTSSYGGTGLGLAICQRLARLMQGRMSVLSEVGEGSDFRLHLRGVAIGEAEESRSQARRVERPELGRGCVLVVDDVPMNRSLIRAYLKDSEVEVLEAENGQVCLELARQHQPQAILMDLRMPVLDGFEAARKLRADPRTKAIPVIGLSATVTSEMAQQSRSLFVRQLNKPVSRDALLLALRPYLPEVERAEGPANDFSEAVDLEPELSLACRDRGVLGEKLERIVEEEVVMLKLSLRTDLILRLADSLAVLAREHDCIALQQYAENLAELAGRFDVASLPAALDELASLCEQLQFSE